MKLVKLGNSTHTLNLENGTEILISYETPVAARIDGHLFATDEKFSRTTSRHINQFVAGRVADPRPQSFFENLLK